MMLRKNGRVKKSNKEGETKVEKDSGAIKGLYIKISSHSNPPEPKGVHPHHTKQTENNGEHTK